MRKKELLFTRVPLDAVTVITALPFLFAAGVIVTVRLAPLPPNTISATGTNTGLLLVAVNVRPAAPFAVPPIVTLITPVDTPAETL